LADHFFVLTGRDHLRHRAAAFGPLFRRIPTLRLAAEFADLRFKHDSQAYGIYELPVAR
jgi:hypothetical protein